MILFIRMILYADKVEEQNENEMLDESGEDLKARAKAL